MPPKKPERHGIGPEEEEGVAMEFFYEDEDGDMADADLHASIMVRVDHPEMFTIDEKIMAPIRERNRKAAKRKQK